MDGSRKEEIKEIEKLGKRISESGSSAPLKAGKKDMLLEREEQFREFFNKMPDAVIILDRKGTILEASEMAEEMSGYRKGELIGKNILTGMSILDAKTKALIIKKIALHFSGKEIPAFEIEMHTKGGKAIPIEINPKIIEYMGKKVELAVIRDITERKQAEREIRESEEKYRFLMDNIEEIVLIISRTGSIVFANKNTLKTFGYSEEEITGKSIVSFLTRGSIKKAMYALAQEFLGKPQPEMEVEARAKSGEIRTLLVAQSSIPVYDKGKMIGIQVNCSDITERKQAEAMLKQQQQEEQIILDSVPAWIFYKDRENRFIRVNRPLADAMGIPKEKLEGRSCFEVYPKEQAESYWKDDKEVIASGKPKRSIIEQMKSKKGFLWVQTDKIPYRDDQGKIIGVIGFTIDITERRKSDEEMKRLNEELKSKVEELEKVNKFAVGRELKMVELKNRIKELEEQRKR